MSNEPRNYFTTDDTIDPSVAVDMTENAEEPDAPYRDVNVAAGFTSEGKPIDKVSGNDAIHAVAAVIQLWLNPDEPLHGYTKYLAPAQEFVSGFIVANPDNGPDFERVYDDTPTSTDPLAALGL